MRARRVELTLRLGVDLELTRAQVVECLVAPVSTPVRLIADARCAAEPLCELGARDQSLDRGRVGSQHGGRLAKLVHTCRLGVAGRSRKLAGRLHERGQPGDVDVQTGWG